MFRLSNSDFDKNWEDYKIGFGPISETGSFWFGNEKLHWLTTSLGDQSLRIELEPCDPELYCNGATKQIAEFITYDKVEVRRYERKKN